MGQAHKSGPGYFVVGNDYESIMNVAQRPAAATSDAFMFESRSFVVKKPLAFVHNIINLLNCPIVASNTW